jgi:hypothetical protein
LAATHAGRNRASRRSVNTTVHRRAADTTGCAPWRPAATPPRTNTATSAAATRYAPAIVGKAHSPTADHSNGPAAAPTAIPPEEDNS